MNNRANITEATKFVAWAAQQHGVHHTVSHDADFSIHVFGVSDLFCNRHATVCVTIRHPQPMGGLRRRASASFATHLSRCPGAAAEQKSGLWDARYQIREYAAAAYRWDKFTASWPGGSWECSGL